VPVTLQTLVVLCLGMVLGPKLGAAAVIAYLAQGAAGLPVFAGTPEKGIGIAYMVGPTGGYLLGFVVAAYVVGWLAFWTLVSSPSSSVIWQKSSSLRHSCRRSGGCLANAE